MEPMEKSTLLSRLKDFLKPSSEHWHTQLTTDMGWFKRHGLFLARVIRLVGRGFRTDHCNLHASALTFFSLLSIVPLLALGLALAKVFGGGDMAREKTSREIALFGERLSNGVSGTNEEITHEFVEKLTGYSDGIFAQIDTISFSTLGGIGLVFLFWMGISMLSQVETSFNSVWGAPPRTLWRKCSDYLTIIIIVPFLALAASTLSIVPRITSFLTGYTSFLVDANGLAQLVQYGVTALLTISVFAVMFLCVPNTKVQFKAGFLGAVLTALCFYLWLKICTALQVGVVRYSKIYGGFAALPILLMWVYYSWQIILIGAEFAFAIQNSETFFQDEGARTASFRAHIQTALVLVAEMARRMLEKEKPLSIADYSRRHGVSLRLARDVLDGLTDAGLTVQADEEGSVYLLARSPESLSVKEVADAVANRGTPPEALGLEQADLSILPYLQQAEKTIDEHLDIPVSKLSRTK